MLRSIDEDDLGGESETFPSKDVLDRELCSLDELSDDGETEQFYDAQLIVHVVDLQIADTIVKIHSALCFDDDSGSVLLKVRAHTRQQKMAQIGDLWNSA